MKFSLDLEYVFLKLIYKFLCVAVLLLHKEMQINKI